MITSWLIWIVGELNSQQGKTKTAFCFKVVAIVVGVSSMGVL